MERREITLKDQLVSYALRRRRYQRRINLIVHQDGQVVVTAPKSCSIAFVEKSIIKNSAWLARQIGQRQKNITIDDSVVAHMKKALRPIVHAKLMQFNEYYSFPFKRVSIRHQKTRWGSCSAEGNLNFNCKLMCVSDELRDYVIVHELCHVKELNHSRRFWELVEKTIPHYRELRKELKEVEV